MSLRIYVAYAWDERQGNVRAMAKILQTIDRFKIWIDIEHLVGEGIASVEEGIDDSDVVLLFVSNKYKEDQRSKKEISYARNRGKLIIPIRLQHAIKMDGPLNFIPEVDCHVDFTTDRPFAKVSDEIILLIKKTLT